MNHQIDDLPKHYWKKFFVEGFFYFGLINIEPTDKQDVSIETGLSKTVKIRFNLN